MKHKTHEAAASLQLHPFDLMLYLAEMGAELDDVWPEIDKTLVDAIRGQNWKKFGSGAGGTAIQEPVTTEHEVSISAVQVIEKLWRKHHWATNTISIETLRAHHCQHVENLDEAIAELVRSGLLLARQHDGPYSLNSKRKSEIERIVNAALKSN